jgi:hypothetical protein
MCLEPLNSSITHASTGGRKFPDHFKGKEIRFFQKIGFLNGLKISTRQRIPPEVLNNEYKAESEINREIFNIVWRINAIKLRTDT